MPFISTSSHISIPVAYILLILPTISSYFRKTNYVDRVILVMWNVDCSSVGAIHLFRYVCILKFMIFRAHSVGVPYRVSV